MNSSWASSGHEFREQLTEFQRKHSADKPQMFALGDITTKLSSANMQCEFEEKQFEQPLNNELMSKKQIFYIPGQVSEGILGFDAAIFSNNYSFWKYFPYYHDLWYHYFRRYRDGIKIDKRWWKELDEYLEHFPQFKYNLFIQHKRPEYLTSGKSSEWKDWGKPYFRFRVTPHQQYSLEQLEQKIGSKGIVVYSCAAFHTLHALWENTRKKRLVETSNFVQAISLRGHDVYSFIRAGNTGKGHSETEDIESYDILDRMSSLSEDQANNENNMTFLKAIASIVDSVMEEDNNHDLYQTMVSFVSEDIETEIGKAINKVHVFCFLKNVRWGIGL